MKSSTKGLITAIVIAAVIIGAFAVSFSDITTTATFWSLVPPVIAIALALITKEVYSSLFIGVLVGAILAADGSVTATLDITTNGLIGAISGTAGIFLFLVLLGAIVALINRAGGSAAFGRWAKTHIKTRIGAQLATFVLGVLIFIDDYFNCLTVGSVMMPVTDAHKISRAKFSYLIDATAAPVCMIAPVSSWAAAVSSSVPENVAAEMSGIELFVRAIPFNYYSLLTLVFIIALVLIKTDYGPMAKHEKNAIENGDLFSTDERVDGEAVEANEKGRVLDLVLPIVALVVLCVLGMLYVGGFFGTDIWGGTELKGDLVGAFGNTDATVALPWGSLIAFIAIVIYMIARKLVSFTGAMEAIPQGFKAMVPAITILTLATALKDVSGLLDSDGFIAKLMESDAAQSLAGFLPAVIFIVACLLSFATGTSWGTFGILIPIVCNMFSISDPLLFIGISACLAGAVCGDHCSPISDTTIMSSAGARCVHVNHVSTQLPYAITVAAISFVMYLVAGLISGLLGFALTAIVTLALGSAVIIALLLFMKKRQAKA